MRLASLLALLVCAAGALAALSPVVIIPGDGGSQLEGRAVNKPSKPHFFCSSSFAWTRMWVAVTEFAPGVIDCWADNMRLVFDAATGAVVNSPGLEFRVPAFGNTSAIEVLDPSLPSQTSYFDKMVARLVAIGLQRGVSVRGAPYDFRHSPRSAAYVSDIVRLIEETYAINSNMPVVLVSHSMGCKVALELLAAQSAEWKARYIRAWVPVSPALGGSNSVLRLFAAGDAEGVPAVSPLSIRSEQRSFESNFWLIPQSELWPGQVLVTTPQRTYTLDDLQQFFADIQVRAHHEMGRAECVAGLISECLHCVFNAFQWHRSTPRVGRGTTSSSPTSPIRTACRCRRPVCPCFVLSALVCRPPRVLSGTRARVRSPTASRRR